MDEWVNGTWWHCHDPTPSSGTQIQLVSATKCGTLNLRFGIVAVEGVGVWMDEW